MAKKEQWYPPNRKAVAKCQNYKRSSCLLRDKNARNSRFKNLISNKKGLDIDLETKLSKIFSFKKLISRRKVFNSPKFTALPRKLGYKYTSENNMHAVGYVGEPNCVHLSRFQLLDFEESVCVCLCMYVYVCRYGYT